MGRGSQSPEQTKTREARLHSLGESQVRNLDIGKIRTDITHGQAGSKKGGVLPGEVVKRIQSHPISPRAEMNS